MEKLKFAMLGCGFWSKFQIGTWTEVEGAELVAVYNRTRSKAEKIAQYFRVPKVYDDPDYIVNHESGIHINRNILDDMLGKGKAENTGAGNLETVRLIWACYKSADTGKTIKIEEFI